MKNKRPKTIFCDLDGTLTKHPGDISKLQDPNYKLKWLPGAKQFLLDCDKKGYNIIITTGRKESAKEATIKQMQKVGVVYDKLLMGIGGGDRIVINDKKKNNNRDTAYAINLERNKGLKNVNI